MPRPDIESISLKELKPLRERRLVEPGLTRRAELPLGFARSRRVTGRVALRHRDRAPSLIARVSQKCR